MNKLGRSQRVTVKLLIQGLSLKEIAAKRGIARSTTINHAMRARRKLKCRSNEQMMYRLGIEAGACIPKDWIALAGGRGAL